jgi:hypothetical protein
MQGYIPALFRIAGNVKPHFRHSDVLAYASTGTYSIETLRHAAILPIVRGWNAASIFVIWLCGTLTKQRIRKHCIFQSTCLHRDIYLQQKTYDNNGPEGKYVTNSKYTLSHTSL